MLAATIIVGALRVKVATESKSKMLQSRMQQTTDFVISILIFKGNKALNFMGIVCQQMILMKHQALHVLHFKKSDKFKNVVCCKF